MLASKKGYANTVRVLAPVEGCMQTTQPFFGFARGSTALMMAKYYGRNEVVEILTNLEADIMNENG